MAEENATKHALVLAVNEYANSDCQPLTEYATLKAIMKACEARIKDIKDDATLQASMVLHAEEPARESGEFQFGGKYFQLSLKEGYDFVDKAHRYTMEEGVNYRQCYYEREALQRQVKAKTTMLNAIEDEFLAKNPNWVPDTIEKTLSWLENPKRKAS